MPSLSVHSPSPYPAFSSPVDCSVTDCCVSCCTNNTYCSGAYGGDPGFCCGAVIGCCPLSTECGEDDSGEWVCLELNDYTLRYILLAVVITVSVVAIYLILRIRNQRILQRERGGGEGEGEEEGQGRGQGGRIISERERERERRQGERRGLMSANNNNNNNNANVPVIRNYLSQDDRGGEGESSELGHKTSSSSAISSSPISHVPNSNNSLSHDNGDDNESSDNISSSSSTMTLPFIPKNKKEINEESDGPEVEMEDRTGAGNK